MINTKEKVIFWLGGIILFVIFLAEISDILLPFIVGILAAYFLDPAADKLEEKGLSRTSATAIITSLFFAVVITSATLLLPVLYDQFSDLAAKIPEYSFMLQEKYGPLIEKVMGLVDPEGAANAKDVLADLSGYAITFTGAILGNAWNSGVAVLNLLSLVFISPIVSFYLVRDWDKLVLKLDSFLPRDHAKTIREQVKLVDQTLSGYIRGQSNVCLMLGIFYAAGLSFVGLDFGLFIGLATGLLAFIPYAGALFGISVALGVAFFQFGDLANMAMVLAVFLVGLAIEGNFITPRLVGEKVGLHPVWIIFGLLAGGSLFGFVGVLIAIPVTAVIGVLIRFAIGEYLKGPLYKGSARKKAPAKKKARAT